jgi:hypothetical protein
LLIRSLTKLVDLGGEDDTYEGTVHDTTAEHQEHAEDDIEQGQLAEDNNERQDQPEETYEDDANATSDIPQLHPPFALDQQTNEQEHDSANVTDPVSKSQDPDEETGNTAFDDATTLHDTEEIALVDDGHSNRDAHGDDSEVRDKQIGGEERADTAAEDEYGEADAEGDTEEYTEDGGELDAEDGFTDAGSGETGDVVDPEHTADREPNVRGAEADTNPLADDVADANGHDSEGRNL